jgi:hypothetical protein
MAPRLWVFSTSHILVSGVGARRQHRDVEHVESRIEADGDRHESEVARYGRE